MVVSHGALAVASPLPMSRRDDTEPQSGGRPAVAATSHGEMLYLAGRPSLRGFIRYVRGHAVEPPPERDLAATWQRAHEVVQELGRSEAGAADGAGTTPLGDEYQLVLEQLIADPLIRNGFNSVPSDIAMVELDRLVVYQKHIDIGFARELAARVGPGPTPEAVFRTCLPFDHPQPPVTWSRVHGDTFVFLSPSNDLRSLGLVRLDRAQVVDYPPPGNVVGMVGVAVGFGSNFLNAIASDGRLILNNGSHRAYAMRSLGVTHVPCIVQHVSSREELHLVADSSVARDADRYTRDPRPAMLRDYFDPRLHVVMESRRRLTEVRVRVETDENWLPAP